MALVCHRCHGSVTHTEQMWQSGCSPRIVWHLFSCAESLERVWRSACDQELLGSDGVVSLPVAQVGREPITWPIAAHAACFLLNVKRRETRRLVFSPVHDPWRQFPVPAEAHDLAAAPGLGPRGAPARSQQLKPPPPSPQPLLPDRQAEAPLHDPERARQRHRHRVLRRHGLRRALPARPHRLLRPPVRVLPAAPVARSRRCSPPACCFCHARPPVERRPAR